MGKKYNSEEITMMCIKFCEGRGLLNSNMSLSEIERIKCNLDKAKEKLIYLVKSYGDDDDRKALSELESDQWEKKDG